MKTKITIEEFIRKEIQKRAQERSIVVIYDRTPSRRFRELVKALGDMASPAIMADEDPVEARKIMGGAVRHPQQIFLYVPSEAPQTSVQKCEDPWSVYAAIGSAFPESPADEYEALACRCYPDRLEDIHHCFAEANGDPDFKTVDYIGHGQGKWPKLAAESGAESRKEMLIWLLVKANNEKVSELTKEISTFAAEVLGLTLKDQCNPKEMQRLLWKQVLCTDFLAGFGEDVPEDFAEVPTAPSENREMVAQALATVRKHADYEAVYIDRADEVQERMGLERFSSVPLHAVQDTFRFEAHRRLMNAIEAVTRLDAQKARAFFPEKSCVWANEPEMAIEWSVVRDGVSCLESALLARDDIAKRAGSLADVIASYDRRGSQLDTAMRRMEEKLLTISTDTFGAMRRALISDYRNTCAEAQKYFIDALLKEGWPAPGVLDNACVFDELVAPKLKATNAVAFIVLDGLRYELSSDLMTKLKAWRPERQIACAMFPTVTSVGKGALLPGGKSLKIVRDKEGELVPSLEGTVISRHKERMNLLNSVYGERFQEMLLSDYLSGKKRLSDKTSLLVLRNDDIDGLLEQNSSAALQSVETTFVAVVKAMKKLQETSLVKFTDVVIVTDHGFVYNYEPKGSDVCAKPAGSWVNFHNRILLGESKNTEASNVIVPASTLGIRAPVKEVAFPRGLCAYEANQYYFHGGVSLQEAVVPVISLRFEAEEPKSGATAAGKVELRPRKPKFTALVVRVIARDATLTSRDTGVRAPRKIEILVNLAGDRTRASVGSLLDNSQGLVTLDGDEEVEFRIKLDSTPFEKGAEKVVVRALDPETRTRLGETSFEVEVMS